MGYQVLAQQLQIFSDIDGRPLNGGYVYVGESGQNPETNPVSIFWDSELSIPAAQPLRTQGGFAMRYGTPTRVYISDIQNSYSIVIKDVNQNIIYSTLKSDFVENKIKVNSVETIEDLAFQGADMPETIIVKDLNRGGTFIWSATGTVNGGTVFAGSTGYWTRQYSGAVNVKWFGAKGDWNGTTGTDDTVAINKALSLGLDTYTNSSGHKITNSLVVSSQKFFSIGGNGKETLGENVRNTILYCDMDAPCITFSNDNYVGMYEIDGFEIQFNTAYATKTSNNGIDIVGGLFIHNFTIKNLVIRNALFGIRDISGSYQGEYSNIHAEDCRYSFYKEGGTTITFDRCFSSRTTQFAFSILNTIAVNITNCAADSFLGTGNMNRFYNINSLSINVFDAEANNIYDYSAFMIFDNCIGTVSNITLLNPVLHNSTVGGNVSLFYINNNSNINMCGITASSDFDLVKNAPTFVGTTGDVSTVIVSTSSQLFITSSYLPKPIGGTPSTSGSIKSFASGICKYINCIGVVSTQPTLIREVLSGYSENIGGLALSGFTITGTYTVSGRVTRVGNFFNMSIDITLDSGATLASTAGTSKINIPFTPLYRSTGTVGTNAIEVVGICYLSGASLFYPTRATITGAKIITANFTFEV